MTKQEYKSIYDVVGVAQEVHKTLGRGLSELIYPSETDRFILLTQDNYKFYVD